MVALLCYLFLVHGSLKECALALSSLLNNKLSINIFGMIECNERNSNVHDQLYIKPLTR